MAAALRSRMFALMAVFMLAVQFPLVSVKVPRQFRNQVEESGFFVSITQIAAATYKDNPSVPDGIIKWLLVPGLLIHDLANVVECQFTSHEKACNERRRISQLDDVFAITNPMCRPDVISAGIKDVFKSYAELVQAGSSLTLGSSIISVIYPVKMGFVGYALLMYCIFKASIAPTMPAIMFLPIFMMATDILSLFSTAAKRAAAAPTPPVPPAAPAPAKSARSGSAKKGK